jgi:PAS domain S-box-containing protein
VIDLPEAAVQLRQTQARLQQLEHAQRQQEAAHQAVLDALPVQLVLLDAEGVIVSVNRAWQHFALANGGARLDVGVGRNYLLLCEAVGCGEGGHADGAAEATEAAEAARCIRAVMGRPGARRSFEYACHSPTEQRWFRMTATGLAAGLDDAASRAALVLHEDITERRLAEQQRERERLLLRTLIDALPDAVYTRDTAARFVICNPAAARAFGVAGMNDLIGKTSLDLLPPDFAARRYAEDLQVLAGNAVVRLEVPSTDHQGQPVWTQMTKLPLRDPQGEVVGLIGILRDISEHKHALAQADQLSARLGAALEDLRAERAQLVAAQAMAKCGNWVIELAGGATQWSDEMHRILQTDPAQVTPCFESYLDRVDPASREATRECFTRSQEQGTDGAREDRLCLPGGETKIIDARWRLDRDAQGRPLRALGTCQDITERKQAEWALQRQQALFGMVLRLGRIGAWAVDLAHDLVIWSDEVCAIHEVPAGTMPTFEEAVSYYPPEWAGIISAATTACARQGTPFDLEAEMITARGRHIWVRAIGEPILDDQGITQRIQGAFQDVSERKQAEHETRQLAARLSDTIESITDCFFTVDRHWRFTHVNGKLLALLPQPYEEVIGRVLWEAFPHLVGTPFEQAYRRAMREGVAVSEQAWLANRQRWYCARAYPSEAGLTVQFRDVSAERAAQQHLELLEASLSQLNDLVMIFGRAPGGDGIRRIQFLNDAVPRATGYTREELLGKPISLLHGPQTDRAVLDRIRTALHGALPVHAQMLHYRKDGTTFWVELAIVPVTLQGEAACTHFVSVERDITERKRDQDALRDLNADLEARVQARTAEANLAREEAERANRAKSAFLANMSHEIRTPMNGVMGMIDVLHQTSLKGYQVEMVDLIRDSADMLLAIVDDILDFSKIEAGKLHIEQQPMQLADAVEKVCALLDHIAVKRGVRMMVFVDPSIPRVLAGDETRVRQVLLNLCSNAIKFSSGAGRTGEMSVRVTLLAQDAHGVNIELTVADNGIGMDNAALARLFTPFSQADGSTTRRFGGTGLGLAITSTLVRLMGGEIAVRSAPAAGSTFTVRLRFARVADAVNDEPVSAAAGLRCRIVGQEQPLAHDLGAYLAHAGAAVEQVPDLAAAAAAPAPAGLCVWLILPGQEVPDLAALRAMAPDRQGHDCGHDIKTRFVVLGRGARRRLRVEAADLVRVDADAMFRHTLIKALSLAAGRVQKASVVNAAEPSEALLQAPPRHEARAQGRLILVAEDNETNRLVIVRQLGLLGYATDLAVNGREALHHWHSGDYALLLTDLHMPEMDGYALAAAIRTEEARQAGAPRTPILALTANAVNDEERRCLAAGMDAYLSKPIRLAPLRQALERWLPGSAAASVAVPAAAEPAPALALAPAGSAPVLDLSALVALVGDDPAVLRSVLRAFRVSVEQLADELRLVATAGPRQALTAVAHKMKSGARAIGAARLAEVCAAIEQCGGEQVGNGLLPQLQAELQAVLAFLDRTEGSP